MVLLHVLDDGDIRSPLTTLTFTSREAGHMYMSAEFGDAMSYIFDDELQAQLDATDAPVDPVTGCF